MVLNGNAVCFLRTQQHTKKMKKASKQKRKNGKKIFPSIIPFYHQNKLFPDIFIIWTFRSFDVIWDSVVHFDSSFSFHPFLKGILLFLLLPSFFQMNEDIKWIHVHFGWVGWIHDFNISEEETTRMERGHTDTRSKGMWGVFELTSPESYRKISQTVWCSFPPLRGYLAKKEFLSPKWKEWDR